MSPVLNFAGGIRRCLEVLASLALLMMLVVTVIDVVGRYFFNAPLPGGVELVEILLALVVFAAFPLITWNEEHICVDLLDDWFPRAMIDLRQFVISLGCAFALGLVAWKVWGLGSRSLSYEEETDILAIPLGYVMYFISITGWLSMVMTLLLAVLYLAKKGPMSAQSAEGEQP
ncbi:putative TRAP-type C4-dicarboxylate transport system, small permease component [Vibrio nigripulchritudo SFn27]|uniref:TRAP transporter small permease protein n=1 Tax=Vibrio nigripulchritudo TaxID=28173 RepID=U4KBN2_9VIBR|nr:TRAP transporter small permease [Vibrio nigripulchritudo]CCN82410.1 putative TRAP-type C4-dicarboxylate transport system, small permease component [Vibrio nigripulchritudo BLFn1]CCN91396.1 putative TRAP-type C4-dicarboxylate transport system, small permease component [Vibrio nigripulchritudo SFn27]CCN97561.1 putative TRAP-type C4-dicarboxylate transport system, small permease component [Vibrio nigripulchritudo ENn2]CCO38703.1 putative TRAP-type C4-dicarboxylate transport system, small permea